MEITSLRYEPSKEDKRAKRKTETVNALAAAMDMRSLRIGQCVGVY